jgi:hypothetical protein
MKRSTVILIVMLCLTTFALPVIAEKEDQGIHAGITIAAAKTQSGSSGEQEKKQGDDDSASLTPATVKTPQEERERTEAQIEERNRTRSRTIAEVQDYHNRSYESLNATLKNVSLEQRERIRNENEVRLAVHTLLEMEDLSGGIGRNVSAIAREFNNSAGYAWTYEERIRNRNTFIRMLFGGDQDAARELANLTIQNQIRIRELNQLMSTATLDPEVRTMMEEQVRIMENERVRLEQLSKREKEDRGFFGWFG